MYNFYLTTEDLLKSEDFPVVALLNEACNTDIIVFVNNLCDGIGSGYNYSNCSFWDDLDEYEQSNIQKFDGLWISNEGNEDVIISLQDFDYYLELLYQRLLGVDFPSISKLRALLDRFEGKIITK